MNRLFLSLAAGAAALIVPTIASAGTIHTYLCPDRADAWQLTAHALATTSDASTAPEVEEIASRCISYSYEGQDAPAGQYLVHTDGGTRYAVIERDGKYLVAFDFVGGLLGD